MATLVASYGDDSGGGFSSSPLQTSSFTPVQGELLVVKAASWSEFALLNTPTGGGLTYVERINSAPSNNCFTAIWTAEVTGSPGSMTVSCTLNGSSGYYAFVVERWSQAKLASSPVLLSTGGSGAPNVNFTTTAANSRISIVNGDWNGQSGTATYRGTSTQTFTYRSNGNFGYYGWYQTVATASTVAVGMTAPSSQKWRLAAIEILDNSAIEQDVDSVKESDVALSVSRGKRKVLGLVTGLSALLGLSKVKSHEVHVAEQASALSVGKDKTHGVGAIHGQESALATTKKKSRLLGVEGEMSETYGLDSEKTRTLGLVQGLDSVLDFQSSKSLGVGLVEESALVQALSRSKAVSVDLVTETGTALTTSRTKRAAVGHVEGLSAVAGTGRSKGLGIGPLGGSQTLYKLLSAKSKLLKIAAEEDALEKLGVDKTLLLGVVAEIDLAVGFGGTLGIVSEVSSAYVLRVAKARTLGTADEEGVFRNLAKAKSLALGSVTEEGTSRNLVVSKLLEIGKLLETNSLEMLVSKKGKLLEMLVEKSLVKTINPNQQNIDRTGPLTDIASLRMSGMNRYGRS